MFWVLVGKDLRTELRSGRLFIATLALGVLLFLVVGIALNGASRLSAEDSSGLLWLVLFFAASVGLSRADEAEHELGGLLGLIAAPIDRSLVFYAKWISTWFVTLLATLGMVLAYFVILNAAWPKHPIGFLLVVVGGTLGLTGVGSFLVQLAGPSTLRDVLVPLLLFPMTIPLFIALIRVTIMTITGQSASLVWIEVLIAYLVLLAVMPLLLYETLMEV